jgi:hypothetical protein
MIFSDKPMEGIGFLIPLVLGFLMMIPAFHFSQKVGKEIENSYRIISLCGVFLGGMDSIHAQRGHQAKNAYAKFDFDEKIFIFSKFSAEARKSILELEKGDYVCVAYYENPNKNWDGSAFSL